MDFSFINGEKINVGKYNIKIIDFGISEINKNCKRNRRFIGAVLNDIKACNAFNKKDIIHIKKDMTSMFFSSFSKKFRLGDGPATDGWKRKNAGKILSSNP